MTRELLLTVATIASCSSGPSAGQSASSSGQASKSAASAPSIATTSLRPTAGEDSVIGTVSVVGTSFDKHVMIAAATRRLEVAGSNATLIGHQAGAEVLLRGKLDGRAFVASSFSVRTVDGKPAIDGVLHIRDGAVYITPATRDPIRIVNPPPALSAREGARVWMTGDPAKAIDSFGFIDPPR